MITWLIYINNTLVDEPQGWSDIVIKVSRDDKWHGVFFEASETTLTFYGAGANLLKAEKQANGLAASATFRAEAVCGETIDVLEGSFDFGTYEETCGNDCMVKISIEKTGCLMMLRNRYDQKVDLSKTTAFDNTTLLPNYTGLNTGLELTAQQIYIVNEAFTGDNPETLILTDDPFFANCGGTGDYFGYMTMPLQDVRNESFGVFNPAAIIEIRECGTSNSNRPPYPDFPTTTGTANLAEEINCELQDVVISYRVKGTINATFSGVDTGVALQSLVYRLNAGEDPDINASWDLLENELIINQYTDGVIPFDYSYSAPASIVPGDFIWFGLSLGAFTVSDISYMDITFDSESFFKIEAASTCENSIANTSLINEAGARIVEAITDSCMTLKSDYYGRTDSQPYISDSDGCGSLRVISNGLRIRNADPSNHFISLEEFFNGLRAIDNIGIGVEPNTVTNFGEWVRIEPVEYFYQDVLIMSLPGIPKASSKLDPTMAYSKISVGYQMWEVEKFNGLNEFNSNKDFRTSLSTVNNMLDIKSNFVAGGIPIEITRQQSFAKSGAADTNYDNETFIICVSREGFYSVEFSAAGNWMIFNVSGNGSEFLVASITIAGTLSNDGTRTILSTALSNLPNNMTQVYIVFNGGTTVDEFADSVTFTGITPLGYFVEKDNITSPANIYSPATAYNWRIRPFYNLMRWFKSIAQVYVNLANTTSQLFFTSGTGNYIAEGKMVDACALENKVLAENDNLTKNEYISAGGVPIYKPEVVQFNYPLSVAEFINIKNNPYGYLSIQCGNGNYEKAFIKSIDYKPVQGEAVFTLIKSWL